MVNVIHKSVCTILLLSLYALLQSNSCIASPDITSNKQAQYFIENKGQITDQYGRQRTDADYRLKASGLSVFISAGELHYQWTKPQATANEANTNLMDAYRLDVVLDGANKGVRPIAEQPMGYYENYYTARLNGVQAYSYAKLVYKNIYDNIDWVVYLQDGGMKYDFIIHPGGNTADIKIRYEGATDMTMNNGEVVVTTPFGKITEKAPYTYYQHSKEPIVSAYKLQGNTIEFDIADYNAPIVIDPSLEWATYMGGSAADYGLCVSSDTAGNVYMAGKTASASSSNVYTTGAHQTTFAADEDGVITRYTAGGVRNWSTYYGGNGKEAINSITVDIENNILFSGWTDTSYTGIATSGAHHPSHGGGESDAFLVKMNPSGVRLWATYYGGEGKEKDGNDYQTGVVCDTAKNIYLVGITNSDTGIATSGTAQTTRGGNFDGFIAKFNKNGVRQWATYYGGADADQFTIVGADSNGIVYVAGNFASTGMGTGGTHAASKPGGGSNDVLIAKFNPTNGARIWATYYGGSMPEQARGLVVGDTNYVYICGSTESTSGIATTGASQTTHGGYYDMFITKFDSNGIQKWGTYLGDNGTDHGGNVVLDHSGNLNMTGSTGSPTTISTFDAFRVNIGGSVDAFIAIFDPAGNKKWATYYGGADQDYGYGVARGKSEGHIYIVGNTNSSTGISYNGSQNAHGGVNDNDAFMVKITPDTSVSVDKGSIASTYCAEDSFVLNYVTTEPFRTGNVFTVQLSNSTGSFASPINIGTKAGTGNSSVKVGFPPNTSGNGFRIRIVATLPIDTSYDNETDIVIKPLPVQPIASNNGPMCSNGVLQLNSTASTTGTAYTWNGPDNYTANTQNATRTNMTASLHSGDYIITANLNGCIRKDTTTVTIIQAAAKPDLTSNAPLCSGDTLRLFANNITNGSTVAWRGPNGWTDTITVSTKKGNMAIADAGKYIVILRLNNCESRDTVDVTVATKPSPVVASSNGPLCSHQTLQLTANCPTPGVVYNWIGPAFVANNEQNPSRPNLQASHTGNYIVTADLLGCGVKDTVYVAISQSPDKPIAAANGPLCSDQDLQLTGTNIGSATPTWVGPNGPLNPPAANKTIVNAQVTDAGDYILTSAYSNGCSQSDTVSVAITQSYNLGGITAVITPGTVVCPSTDLIFSVTPPQTNATYTWIGPNSFSSSSPSPTRNNAQYADSGFYVVQVVTGACSLGVDTVHLAVVDTITAPTLTLPLFDCEQDSLKVNAFHPYMNAFDFIYPGDTDLNSAGLTILSLNKVVHEGRWILRVRSGGCMAADTGYLTLRPKPTKPNATSNTPVCEGETLELKGASPTAGVTYAWSGPASYAANTQNANLANVVPVTNAGYYVLQTTLNGCASDLDSEAVVIHANPKPKITINDPVCEGKEIKMSVTDPQTGESYVWSSSNAGFSGNGTSATIAQAKLADGGTYILTATSATTGCVGVTTAPLEVIALPGLPDGIYNTPLCEGNQLELNVNDTSTTNVSYVWTGPGGFTFFEKKAFKNEIKLSDAGSYILVASRRGCEVSDTVDVIVKPTPEKPSVINNGPLASGETLELTIENPTPGATFKWNGPSNYGSFVQNPTLFKVTESASGTYTVVTSLDGCTSSGFTVVIVNKGDAKKEELILFPNPNKGIFTIRAKVINDQIMPYEVLNTLGMVVYSDIVQTVDQKMERVIEIDGKLASGVYFLRIMMSGQSREVPFTLVR